MFIRIENIVYVDESGLNRYYRRLYARAKRGAKVYDKKPGKKDKKTNIIGGLLYSGSGKKHVAVNSYEHTTNAMFFENWFEWELLGVIPQNTVIIMDNASFHRKNKLIEIAMKHGFIVLFLPPYSPEYNPIEKSWANFKQWLKYNLQRFPSIEHAINWYFNYAHY
jgi:transposase